MKKNLPSWHDLPAGAEIKNSGNSDEYCTGAWSTAKIKFIPEKCRNCGLCFTACPDSAILRENGKVVGIDLKHCKKCGLCEKVCNFGAIEISEK